MSKIKLYTPTIISRLRALVKDCPTWLVARQKLTDATGSHPDNITKMNRRHGFWDQRPAPPLPLPPPARKIRRLFFDIETSPNVVLSWRIGYKINLDHSNILKERAVICLAYKWEGESEVHALQWDRNQCDKAMLEAFLKVVNEADEIVMHNGDKFDLPWFKTRCIFHGIPAMPDYKTVDTLQWARRKFYFNSNRLDYIAKFLGLGGKIKTEFGLWKEIVLNQSSKAMIDMVTYCKKDVALLEQVWARLSQMVPHKTHVGVLNGGENWSCPRDGSLNVITKKTRVTANGTMQFEMKCLDCGGYYTISAKAHAAYKLAKQ